MIKSYFGFAFFGAIFLLAGCGSSGSSDQPVVTHRLSGLEYKVLDGNLKPEAARLSGTGRALFRTALVNPDYNFTFDTTLEEGGELSLFARTDENLAGGAEIKFARSGTKLLVTLTRNKTWDLSPGYTAIDASAPHNFSVDVHAHGHIVIWVDDKFIDEYAIDGVSLKYWGLKLKSAAITSAKVGDERQKD